MIAALTNSSTGEMIGNYLSVKLKLEESLQDRIHDESNAVRVLVSVAKFCCFVAVVGGVGVVPVVV